MYLLNGCIKTRNFSCFLNICSHKSKAARKRRLYLCVYYFLSQIRQCEKNCVSFAETMPLIPNIPESMLENKYL